MTIKLEELDSLQGETPVKVEQVFFEKADKPTSRTGAGISEGILLLTNKRLFFLNIKKGKSTIGKMGINFVTGLADEFTFGLASLAEHGIEKGIEHLNKKNYEDYKLYAQKQDSFVVPIERIVSCEKYGGMFSLTSKGKYIKIIILDEFEKKSSYCIYYINPKNQQSTIKYEKWFDEINNVRKVIQQEKSSYTPVIRGIYGSPINLKRQS